MMEAIEITKYILYAAYVFVSTMLTRIVLWMIFSIFAIAALVYACHKAASKKSTEEKE